MVIYRISREKARVEIRAAVLRSTCLVTVAVILGVLIGGRSTLMSGKADALWFSTLGLLVLLAVFYIGRKTKRGLAELYSSFELSLDGECVTRKQKNAPLLSLTRSEIRRIEDYNGKGFRICTEERNRNIWVPAELGGYDELKAELLLSGVEHLHKENYWLRRYLPVGLILVLFGIQGFAPNKYIAAGAAFLISVWLVWIFVLSFRNPNLTRAGRRQLYFLCLIVVALVARGILLLRG